MAMVALGHRPPTGATSMQFFNIRAQVVSLVMPDGRSAVNLDFRQSPADAMVQELYITPPGGGPTAVLTFQKAGGLVDTRWEGVDTQEAPLEGDLTVISQLDADVLGLKPGQKAVDSAGRRVMAPGRFVPPSNPGQQRAARPVDSADANPPGGAQQGNGDNVNTTGSMQAGAEAQSIKARPPADPNA